MAHLQYADVRSHTSGLRIIELIPIKPSVARV